MTPHTISRRFEWQDARELSSRPKSDAPVPSPPVEPPAAVPSERTGSTIGRRQALDSLAAFDRTPDRVSYDVDHSLRGVRFRDYFAGNLHTVGRRKFERSVRRNKVTLLIAVIAVGVLWVMARFVWPS